MKRQPAYLRRRRLLFESLEQRTLLAAPQSFIESPVLDAPPPAPEIQSVAPANGGLEIQSAMHGIVEACGWPATADSQNAVQTLFLPGDVVDQDQSDPVPQDDLLDLHGRDDFPSEEYRDNFSPKAGPPGGDEDAAKGVAGKGADIPGEFVPPLPEPLRDAPGNTVSDFSSKAALPAPGPGFAPSPRIELLQLVEDARRLHSAQPESETGVLSGDLSNSPASPLSDALAKLRLAAFAQLGTDDDSIGKTDKNKEAASIRDDSAVDWQKPDEIGKHQDTGMRLDDSVSELAGTS